METFPKRRKDKNNPYILGFNNITNNYTITFKDALEVSHTIEITKELYTEFNKFELADLSIMNEYDRHIEHLEQTEEALYHRATQKQIAVETEVMQKITYEELKKEIDALPKIQKRRLKMYFFDNLKFREIAEIEGCSIRSIKYSVDIAVKKLSDKIKKNKN